MEPGWSATDICEWWDALVAAEPGPVVDARARLAWFGLDLSAPPLLAERQENG